MDYRKEGKIKQRIIKYSDVLAIAAFFEELVEHDGGKCSFDIRFQDDTSLSDVHAAVFDSSFFKRRDVKSIWYSYSSEDYQKQLTVRIEESVFLSGIDNEYELKSSDEMWFNAILNKLLDLLNSIKKRMILRRVWTMPWGALLIFPYQVFMNEVVIELLGFQEGTKPDPFPEGAVFIPWRIYLLMCIALFFGAFITIHLLYPESEFDFGARRYECRQKARKVVGWILTAIVLPIALSAMF